MQHCGWTLVVCLSFGDGRFIQSLFTAELDPGAEALDCRVMSLCGFIDTNPVFISRLTRG